MFVLRLRTPAHAQDSGLQGRPLLQAIWEKAGQAAEKDCTAKADKSSLHGPQKHQAALARRRETTQPRRRQEASCPLAMAGLPSGTSEGRANAFLVCRV
eukprot:8125189-Pyramimonas_sp.AAC.1